MSLSHSMMEGVQVDANQMLELEVPPERNKKKCKHHIICLIKNRRLGEAVRKRKAKDVYDN